MSLVVASERRRRRSPTSRDRLDDTRRRGSHHLPCAVSLHSATPCVTGARTTGTSRHHRYSVAYLRIGNYVSKCSDKRRDQRKQSHYCASVSIEYVFSSIKFRCGMHLHLTGNGFSLEHHFLLSSFLFLPLRSFLSAYKFLALLYKIACVCENKMRLIYFWQYEFLKRLNLN